jgi:hypothetical protein
LELPESKSKRSKQDTREIATALQCFSESSGAVKEQDGCRCTPPDFKVGRCLEWTQHLPFGKRGSGANFGHSNCGNLTGFWAAIKTMRFQLILKALACAVLCGLSAIPSEAGCIRPGKESVAVHWFNAKPKELSSPDCRWMLILRPTHDTDERSLAYVRDETTGKQHQLFKVERDGTVHWGRDGNSLFVEDFYTADYGRFLLFAPLDAALSERNGLAMDSAIRADVPRRIGRRQKIWYYWISFVSWQNERLTVTVTVETTRNGKDGPFTSTCIGYEIAPTPFAISKVLTSDQIKTRYDRSCEN